MRFRGLAISCLSLAAFSATPTLAQFDDPSEQLRINTDSAATWEQPGESVVSLEGPVTIELDQATLTARRAVIWLSRVPGEGGRQRAEIALVGEAQVTQKDAKRTGERLFVTALVSGKIRFTAETRVEDNRSNSELYATAQRLRDASGADEPAAKTPAPPAPVAPPIEPGREAPAPVPARPTPPPPVVPADPRKPVAATAPAPQPTTGPVALAPGEPVTFRAKNIESIEGDDGKLAIVLSDGVTLFQSTAAGVIELQADSAVVFTTLDDPKQDIQNLAGSDAVSKSINAAYLEGDVRIVYTPTNQAEMGEQRLEAKRAYYEFSTGRAILTEAVVHTVQPQLQIPVVLRARIVRQLAAGEYKAEDAKLSTSRFAMPSYSINAKRMYVRREDTGNPRVGSRTAFSVAHPTFRFFNVPVFYLPGASGSMTDQGTILRGIGFENSTAFGAGIETEWGLFETLGLDRPNELDATYRLDYYGDRGPAGGLDFEYGGGAIAGTSREQANFEGVFTSYGVYDEGFDDFGRGRVGEDNANFDGDADFRGHVLYEHQHFFAEDFQLQFRAGYVSDATFLEQWFDKEFDEESPHDVSLYVKKQRDTEAYTLLIQGQPSDVVTTSDLLQEQFEVERLPEFGYRRIGDSFGDDRFTFFSRNTVGAYQFQVTRATLAEQGFGPGRSPGIPSIGYTGVDDQELVARGDFRQEIGMPLAAGPFKFVPYVVGRYTGYGDSPEDGSVNRLFGAVGARVSTSFWKMYNGVESKLFDIHRVRHVIEPEVNAFAAASTDDNNDVFVYEEDVDGIRDLSAVQVALRQRWQTKRGGPGRWRSVDFFTLNIEGNFFANQPDEDERNPVGFRGLFFASQPETSVPRNSANADAMWRISDNTVVLADVQQNLDKNRLATAGIGLLVRRDERLTYFVGNRYIDELTSNITSIAVSYELSPKYTLTASQSYDFGLSQNVNSSFGVLRQFDTFFVAVSASHDSTTDQSSFNFNLFPKGLGYGINAEQLGGVFRNER